MESGARAVEAELLQPQTGRPVTKHCTAQGLTTTTATGIDIRNTASVITPQTLLNTVSIAAFTPCRPTPSLKSLLFLRVKGFNGELCFIPTQRGYFPCADSPEVFGEACRGGRYESNTQRCGFFNQKHPANEHIYCSQLGLKCQTPAHLLLLDFSGLRSGFYLFIFCCSHYGSFFQGPIDFWRIDRLPFVPLFNKCTPTAWSFAAHVAETLWFFPHPG